MKKLVLVITVIIISIMSMTACTGIEDVATDELKAVAAYEATYEANKDNMTDKELDEFMIDYAIRNDMHLNDEVFAEMEKGYYFYLVDDDETAVRRYEKTNDAFIVEYARGI